MVAAGTPVVFVHGLWLHATAWEPWLKRFGEQGYAPVAATWPGDSESVREARAHPDRVAGVGIDDVVDHVTQLIAGLDAKPIVIGHSFGGLIAQRLLAQGSAAAAVAIDPAPIKGVLLLPASALRVASVALRNPANNAKRAVSLTPAQFRYAFGNAIPEAESARLFEQWTIPSPGKPLFEAALANATPKSAAAVDTKNPSRGPLLLVAGGKDHTVPPSTVRTTLKLHHKSPAVTDLKHFPDRGHSLVVDHGWEQIADAALTWLSHQAI
jgi:pimeloyl-ACP methyl ester carboxylesterase